MSEVFEVKCVDCGNAFGIVSPGHLICQKCGSGQVEFSNAVIFSCHKGHEERGRIASEVCKKCYNFEQRSLRNFKRMEPVKKKAPEPPVEVEEEEEVKLKPAKRKRTKGIKIKTSRKKK